MKTFNVQIVGITPLLQHRFRGDPESDTRTVVQERGTPREEAEKVVYRDDEIGFYFPGAWIARNIRESGGNHKMRGSRKAVKWVVPAGVIVPQDAIPLLNGDGRTPAVDFEVDSRPVTIPSTKGRIMRHRPRFDHWSARFHIEIEPDVLPVALVHQLLSEGGQRIGVGDYRPMSGGPFGRFQVTLWEELPQD